MREAVIKQLTEFAKVLKDAGISSMIVAYLDERFSWEFGRLNEAELEELEKIFHSIEHVKPEPMPVFYNPPKPIKQKEKILAVAESEPEKKSVEPQVKEVKGSVNKDIVISERTDRNGTKHQVVRTACDRCGGRGGSDMWKNTGWTCLKCGGNGKMEVKRKIYTPEHEEKLRIRREKRAEAKRQEAIENAKSRNEEYLKEIGFDQEKIYVVLGDTFIIREDLKEAGAHWGGKPIGWYFSQKPMQWETCELDVEKLIWYNDIGEVIRKNNMHEEYVEYVESVKKKHSNEHESEWIGEVGERVELDLRVVSSFGMDTDFGWSCINKLIDLQGNIFIWKTSKDLVHMYGESTVLKIKGTIKEHSEYRNDKQNVLTRCKIQNELVYRRG